MPGVVLCGACRLRDGDAARGMTALMVAASNGHAECLVRQLAAAAAAESRARDLLCAATSDGTTALMLAAKAASASCVALLLERLPPEERERHVEAATSSDGTTALMVAAMAGAAECAALLLERLTRSGGRRARYVQAANVRGKTALMLAAQAGMPNCVDLLLSAAPAAGQVLAADDHGSTALMWALEGEGSAADAAACVGLLVAAGSDLCGLDRDQRRVLDAITVDDPDRRCPFARRA